MIAVEKKMPDVSSLVKRTDYDAKISEIENKVNYHDHDEYTTTSEFNKLTTKNFKISNISTSKFSNKDKF